MIFPNICVRVDVSQEILLKAFSIIVTGLALDYYYSNTSINTSALFNKVGDSIETNFRGAKYKRNILFKCNITILKVIIKKNEGISIKESL